jgi:hypothetical protein
VTHISFGLIEPIANHIRKARLERKPVQLSAEQVALLDEWMQATLELQADSEWLMGKAISDERADFVTLEEADHILNTLDAEGNAVSD